MLSIGSGFQAYFTEHRQVVRVGRKFDEFFVQTHLLKGDLLRKETPAGDE